MQGNAAQRLDLNGNVLGSYTFDAYGTRYSTDNSTDPYTGFGAQWGYYRDPETGLSLLGHRYYDPGQGRFLNRDSAGYGGGLNLYGYVGNNPMGGIDPTGNGIAGIIGGVIGFGLGAATGNPYFAVGGAMLGAYLGNRLAGMPAEDTIPDGVMGAEICMLAGPALAATGAMAYGPKMFGGGSFGGGGDGSIGGGGSPDGFTRVGRWMSQEEFDATAAAGQVQSTLDGLDAKSVSAPPDPGNYRAASSGSVFAEFDVPASQLAPGGKPGWAIAFGPNSIHGRLAASRGMPVPGMPVARNIIKHPNP